MEPMDNNEMGMELNPQVLSQTQQNIIAQQAVRIAQLEAGIQQLMIENQQLRMQIPMDETSPIPPGPADAVMDATPISPTMPPPA